MLCLCVCGRGAALFGVGEYSFLFALIKRRWLRFARPSLSGVGVEWLVRAWAEGWEDDQHLRRTVATAAEDECIIVLCYYCFVFFAAGR